MKASGAEVRIHHLGSALLLGRAERSIPNVRQGRACWREGLTAKARAKRQSDCHDGRHRLIFLDAGLGRNLLTDRPQEGSELAGDRRCRNRGTEALFGTLAVRRTGSGWPPPATMGSCGCGSSPRARSCAGWADRTTRSAGRYGSRRRISSRYAKGSARTNGLLLELCGPANRLLSSSALRSDDTDARKATLRRFGRSDRRAQQKSSAD